MPFESLESSRQDRLALKLQLVSKMETIKQGCFHAMCHKKAPPRIGLLLPCPNHLQRVPVLTCSHRPRVRSKSVLVASSTIWASNTDTAGTCWVTCLIGFPICSLWHEASAGQFAASVSFCEMDLEGEYGQLRCEIHIFNLHSKGAKPKRPARPQASRGTV